MIAYISGVVVDRGVDYIVVDNQGIGYQIYYSNPGEVILNEQAVFHTYQHVREDAIILFGFKTKDALAMFIQLISVKGVGPKTGLNILAKTTASHLIQAINDEDIKFLRTLPSVGPKMASQMVLDLKGKLVVTDDSKPVSSQSLDALEETIDALMALGFKRQEINNIKNELLKMEHETVDQQIRVGLQLLNARKRGN